MIDIICKSFPSVNWSISSERTFFSRFYCQCMKMRLYLRTRKMIWKVIEWHLIPRWLDWDIWIVWSTNWSTIWYGYRPAWTILLAQCSARGNSCDMLHRKAEGYWSSRFVCVSQCIWCNGSAVSGIVELCLPYTKSLLCNTMFQKCRLNSPWSYASKMIDPANEQCLDWQSSIKGRWMNLRSFYRTIGPSCQRLGMNWHIVSKSSECIFLSFNCPFSKCWFWKKWDSEHIVLHIVTKGGCCWTCLEWFMSCVRVGGRKGEAQVYSNASSLGIWATEPFISTSRKAQHQARRLT